jgi:hypothetical protein
MTHTDHGDGDQHDVQVNGDGDHHVTIGHTVLQLCECRSYRSTFTRDNVIFLHVMLRVERSLWNFKLTCPPNTCHRPTPRTISGGSMKLGCH